MDLPPFESVPNEWENYIERLEVIATFTNHIEGDLSLQ